jgi:proteasome lid subunit RPN8/RPN11
MLTITSEQLEQLQHHGIACFPEECCGVLLGQNATVLQICPTQNSWTADLAIAPESSPELAPNQSSTTSRLNRFAIAPRELLQIQKTARTQQLQIIGIYHSHPNHPAIPSEYDRAIAWDCYSYLIMSVQATQVVDSRSWRLNGDRQFTEEKLQIIP